MTVAVRSPNGKVHQPAAVGAGRVTACRQPIDPQTWIVVAADRVLDHQRCQLCWRRPR